MAGIGTSLTTTFDFVWDRFQGRLAGLSDEEYFWEPVPGCWSVRQSADGRWRIDGEGGGGPAPDPVPVTTIAWRIGHIGFGDRLFADGKITLDDVVLAPSAAAAAEYLAATYRGWRVGIEAISEERWWRGIGAAFGPYAESTTTDLVLHVMDELTHHAAEVGLLRDLYLYRDRLGSR